MLEVGVQSGVGTWKMMIKVLHFHHFYLLKKMPKIISDLKRICEKMVCGVGWLK